jgi:hypothetical protein
MAGAAGEHPASGARRSKTSRSRSASAGNHGSTMKKVKLINDIPPVQNGVISASKTPVINKGRLVDIPTDNSDDMSLFFEGNEKEKNDIPEYPVSQSVTSILKSTQQQEKAL